MQVEEIEGARKEYLGASVAPDETYGSANLALRVCNEEGDCTGNGEEKSCANVKAVSLQQRNTDRHEKLRSSLKRDKVCNDSGGRFEASPDAHRLRRRGRKCLSIPGSCIFSLPNAHVFVSLLQFTRFCMRDFPVFRA